MQALKNAGVTEVVLAINYQPEVCTSTPRFTCSVLLMIGAELGIKLLCILWAQVMYSFISEWGEKLGVKIVCSQVCGLKRLIPMRSQNAGRRKGTLSCCTRAAALMMLLNKIPHGVGWVRAGHAHFPGLLHG